LIFGHCSNEEIQTSNAWAAVGVGDQSNCTGTGIAKELFEEARIYPNPVKDELLISFKNHKERMIQLYSVNGFLLRVIGITNNQQLRVNTSTLASGVYLIRIFEKDRSYIIKFIKN